MTARKIDVGPFAEVKRRMADFSLNLFTACVIQESVDKLEAAEQAYNDALESENVDEIDRTKMEYDAMKTSFMIATQFAYHDSESYQ